MTERLTREDLAATMADAEATTTPFHSFDYFCRSCSTSSPEHHAPSCAVPLVERLVGHIRALEADVRADIRDAMACIDDLRQIVEWGDQATPLHVQSIMTASEKWLADIRARYAREEGQG